MLELSKVSFFLVGLTLEMVSFCDFWFVVRCGFVRRSSLPPFCVGSADRDDFSVAGEHFS